MRGRFGWVGLSGVLAWACAQAPAREQTPRALTLLHTADIHSRLWPFRSRISSFEAEHGLGPAGQLVEVGGAARLATALARERRRGPSLWLDSGDALEGAEVFERFGGRPELELLGSLGLDAMALGNHELSLDGLRLGALLRGSARFPVLSANLRAGPGSPLAAELLPSTVLALSGLRIGVIGVSHPESPPNLNAAANPWQLSPEPLAQAVQLAIDELAGRAALVVVLSHLGLDRDHELVAATSGIDLVLGGHQHIITAEPEWQDDCAGAELQAQRGCSPRRVPIVHSGAYGRWLSRLELGLRVDAAQPSEVELDSLELEQVPLGVDVTPEPHVATYLEQERPDPEPPLAFLPEALARRGALGGDAPLGDLVTDAMLAASGADVALLNSSGLRADLEAGELLRSDLELAFPFAEPWRLVWVDGASLRRGLLRAARRSAAQDCTSVLQASGLRLTLTCAACRAGQSSCLRVTRPSAWGERALTDGERLLLALPGYLTLPGADFEEIAARGGVLDGSIPRALVSYSAGRRQSAGGAACARALQQLSVARCAEAFGLVGCPLAAERAQAFCESLPRWEALRDERITMLP